MEAVQCMAGDLEETSRSLKTELESIIGRQQINTLFQPIFDLADNTVFTYEALSRGPVESTLFQPDMLFETAYHHKMASELDYVCRHKAIENFVTRQLPGKLALNI